MKHSLSSIKTLAAAQKRLSSKTDQIASLEEALMLTGQAMDAERVRLYKLSNDGALLDYVAQWAKESMTVQDKSPLVVDTLEHLETGFDQVHAQPIYQGPHFTGMLMIEAGAIRKQLDPDAKELARNLATMLAPCLDTTIGASSPTKLSRPNKDPEPEESEDLNILVVEDDEPNLFLIKRFIQKYGAVPHAARNGQDAIQICKEIKFDLILMDLTMPKLDGFDATREIVTGENLNRNTPVVAVTADVTDGIERRCKKIGIQHYIAKPIRRETILKVLAELTSKKPKPN